MFQICQAFASPDETAAMRAAYADGIGWGDAKQRLFERIDAEVAPLREQYELLIAHPQRIEAQLRDGATRLRERHAIPRLRALRDAVGLRDLSATTVVAAPSADKSTATAPTASLATFKQYREADGKFYFKLVDGERVLLQSVGFDSPKDAGARVARLKHGEFESTDSMVSAGPGVALDEIEAALAAMATETDAK